MYAGDRARGPILLWAREAVLPGLGTVGGARQKHLTRYSRMHGVLRRGGGGDKNVFGSPDRCATPDWRTIWCHLKSI